MRCGRCGAASPDGKRFCGDCGGALGDVCPACSAPVEPGKRFCGDCGSEIATAAVADASAAPALDRPVAERRVCSVLFCDLVGFTPLAEARDPEAVRELLSRYFETSRTVISRYGGTVEKFIGDAVMAVWGAPVATESDAERAVRAGLDLIDTIRQLGDDAGVVGLSARAGVVTGEVAVTIGATNEGMVAGDAVNTAARVQAAASAGQVLVDATTRRLAASAIAFDDEGERELKGKSEPVHVWRAVRVVSSVGGAQRIDGLEAPLTGRGAEVRLTRELFLASAERHQTRLVLVTGPAGVGKSRLGWEFEKYVDGLADDVYWHRGRCLSYGEGLVYWALAATVRQRLDIAEEDSQDATVAKLLDGLDRFVPDVADRSFIGIRIGRLLGVAHPDDGRGELGREDLFAGWRRFFEQLAAVHPVTILIEDAHHAHRELIDFVDQLVDWSRDQPIFVLVLARPEIDDRHPGFGSGRNRARITLDPLDTASMDALVDALLPGAPTGAREAIVERAQGIPLYAVESIRSLIDRDVVQPVDGVYRLVGDIGILGVPDSLHALLAARLDGLDPAARRIVSTAAVLGTTFSRDAIIAVCDLDEATTAPALRELLRREVLEISADPLSPERGNYRFTQDLLRQVAYETLSRRDRKALHLTAADHLRSVFAADGEEVIAVIARHHIDAIDAVPDDPDVAGLRELAVSDLTRAAERAARAGSPARAAAAYLEAADLVEAVDPTDPRAATLLLASAHAATSILPAAAIPTSERAVAAALTIGDERAIARARTQLGRALRVSGRLSEARPHLAQALDVLRDDPDADTFRVLIQLATLASFAGEPDADRLTAEAVALAEALDLDGPLFSSALSTRGIQLSFAGRSRTAAMYLREASRVALDCDDARGAASALLNLSDILNKSDPVAGADAARHAVEVAVRSGEANQLAAALYNLAIAQLATGDWDECAATLAHPDTVLIVDDELLTVVRGLLAALRGDGGHAAQLVDGLTDLVTNEDLQMREVVMFVGAFVAAAQGRPADALRIGHELITDEHNVFGDDPGRWVWPLAARSAHEVGDLAAEAALLDVHDRLPPGLVAPVQHAEALLIRARLTAAHDPVAAGPQYVAALDALRTAASPYHLAHGLLDHAEHLADHGRDHDAATDAIAEAVIIAERLDCAPLRDRARRLRHATAGAQR